MKRSAARRIVQLAEGVASSIPHEPSKRSTICGRGLAASGDSAAGYSITNVGASNVGSTVSEKIASTSPAQLVASASTFGPFLRHGVVRASNQ
jgi:hypothetical protein